MVRHRISYGESILLGEFGSVPHNIQTNGIEMFRKISLE
jgi:hypothetical protein